MKQRYLSPREHRSGVLPRTTAMRNAVAGLLMVVAASSGCSTSGSSARTLDATAPDAANGGDAAADGARPTTCSFPSFTPAVGEDGGLVAQSCPATCPVPVSGTELDSQAQCTRNVFMGCIVCPDGCGGAPEGTCHKYTRDGRLVRVPDWAVQNDGSGGQGWIGCTSAEDARFNAAVTPCP